MFWMWMMASMIALELNSVTKIHNDCIRFHSLMVKCQLHIIIQNFFFHSNSYYVTYNKSFLSSLNSLSAMRCISNTVTSYIQAIAQFTVVLGIAQIMPYIARQSLVCITNATWQTVLYYILIHKIHCICVQSNVYMYMIVL